MVMGLLAKLLMTKQLKFENGVIELKGTYLALIPSFFIAELTKYYRNTNNLHKFYMLAWYWGFVLVRSIACSFKLKTQDQIYSVGMDLGEAMGLGLYKTHDYYPGRYTHFVVKTNPIKKYFVDEKIVEPLDVFVSGAMAGGGCLVHKQVCQNVETKCIIKGDAECDFITGTEQELRNRNLWDIALKRYKLDKILPLQTKIFNEFSEDKEAQLSTYVINKLNEI
jgi:hypothetical protein